MIIGDSTYYELLRYNYRPQRGKWMKMNKEEAKAYDIDSNISTIFASDMEDSSDNSDYPDDIDEFEYDEDGHAIYHSKASIGINYQTDLLVVLASHTGYFSN